ncbi:hypothetical protein GUY44_25455 [Pimelobacter simplex]|uniref:Putative secreted protein n=1 Tax=Nocardioides simplex TaxID=2045 RepID=A0A0A1DSR6_NOCSI|nr:DUF5719 family protein [Pimelobacter simplex]AIY18440.1 Putative secreted protein [Pimelobacter simplex]MCG8153847.1 hypothetical protein [Pimelobacter simplex]GEB16274.1 hypothetical protein NSI01_45890 [Pimelobacter simplex]SFM34808.1 hypothetical protein SAMN05421671_1387 [Pimelobacter simplex]
MTDPTPAPAGRSGRRASVVRRRRVDILVALAIGLPTVVALGVGAIGGEDTPQLGGVRPPTSAALTSATEVCPSGLEPGATTIRVGRSPGVPGGDLDVLTGAGAGADATVTAASPVPVPADGTAVVPGSTGATVLTGKGDAAPGIVAGRGESLAVPECRAPAYDEWLVGLGASARYATTVELVNPDDGEAVVDIALSDASGPVEEPALRGIQVPAHGVKRIDLAVTAPRRTLTAAHVTVIRGRVTATARTTRDPLGRGRVTTDFQPAQAAPDTENLILGIPAKPAGATLHVANPGQDEVRATVRLVTTESTFTPTEAEPISVAPGALATVDLGPMLSGKSGEGVVGVLVESPEPVVASVRLLQASDLVLLAPAIDVREPTAAVVPTGAKTLLVGGAQRAGVVHVTSYDAAGTSLRDDQLEVAPDRAASLALPPGAVRVSVEPRNTRVSGVFSMPVAGRQGGLATLRLRPAETHARIPAVAPE